MNFNELCQLGEEVFDYSQTKNKKHSRPKLKDEKKAALKELIKRGRKAEKMLQYIEGKKSRSQFMRSMGIKPDKLTEKK